MGFFDFLKQPNINDGVERFKSTPNSVLIDVRTKQEYSLGHIPDSINVPLEEINRLYERVESRKTQLFIYCLSGTRSGQAYMLLKRNGYQNVENIGGIGSYTGEIVNN